MKGKYFTTTLIILLTCSWILLLSLTYKYQDGISDTLPSASTAAETPREIVSQPSKDSSSAQPTCRSLFTIFSFKDGRVSPKVEYFFKLAGQTLSHPLNRPTYEPHLYKASKPKPHLHKASKPKPHHPYAILSEVHPPDDDAVGDPQSLDLLIFPPSTQHYRSLSSLLPSLLSFHHNGSAPPSAMPAPRSATLDPPSVTPTIARTSRIEAGALPFVPCAIVPYDDGSYSAAECFSRRLARQSSLWFEFMGDSKIREIYFAFLNRTDHELHYHLDFLDLNSSTPFSAMNKTFMKVKNDMQATSEQAPQLRFTFSFRAFYGGVSWVQNLREVQQLTRWATGEEEPPDLLVIGYASWTLFVNHIPYVVDKLSALLDIHNIVVPLLHQISYKTRVLLVPQHRSRFFIESYLLITDTAWEWSEIIFFHYLQRETERREKGAQPSTTETNKILQYYFKDESETQEWREWLQDLLKTKVKPVRFTQKSPTTLKGETMRPRHNREGTYHTALPNAVLKDYQLIKPDALKAAVLNIDTNYYHLEENEPPKPTEVHNISLANQLKQPENTYTKGEHVALNDHLSVNKASKTTEMRDKHLEDRLKKRRGIYTKSQNEALNNHLSVRNNNGGIWWWDTSLPLGLAGIEDCRQLYRRGLGSRPLFYTSFLNCMNPQHAGTSTLGDQVTMLLNLLCNSVLGASPDACCH